MVETSIDRHLSKSLSQNKQKLEFYHIMANSIGYYYEFDSELIVC